VVVFICYSFIIALILTNHKANQIHQRWSGDWFSVHNDTIRKTY